MSGFFSEVLGEDLPDLQSVVLDCAHRAFVQNLVPATGPEQWSFFWTTSQIRPRFSKPPGSAVSLHFVVHGSIFSLIWVPNWAAEEQPLILWNSTLSRLGFLTASTIRQIYSSLLITLDFLLSHHWRRMLTLSNTSNQKCMHSLDVWYSVFGTMQGINVNRACSLFGLYFVSFFVKLDIIFILSMNFYLIFVFSFWTVETFTG